MAHIRGTGSTFQTTVKGVKVWQATKTVNLGTIKKRVTGRGSTPQLAWERLEENRNKLLVKYGKAPQSILRQYGKAERLTVEEWLEQWLNSNRRRSIQANSRFRQQGLVKNHILPHIGSKQLRDLTSDHLNALIYVTLPNLKKEDGTQLLGSTPIRGVYYILKQALTEAHSKNKVGYNPITEVEAPKKDDPKNQRIADKVEVPRLIMRATRGTEDEAYWLLCCFGVRQSERLGIEWSSFTNLTKSDGTATLTIDRQLYNNAEIGKLQIKHSTKSKAGERVIPMPENMRLMFLRHKSRQNAWKKLDGWNPTDEFKNLVFTTNEGAPIRQNADNRAWQKLLKDNALEPMKQHSMRHITATMLAEENFPIDIVKGLLGHSSTAMSSYYTHIGTRAKKPAMEAISKAISVNETLGEFIENRTPKAQRKSTKQSRIEA